MDFNSLPRGLPNTSSKSGTAPRALWMPQHYLTDNEFWKFKRNKVFLGMVKGQPISIKDDRHLMTIAGTRAGKGTSVIIPNLLIYTGSVMVIDPKGENATITAEKRAKDLNQDVYVIDPFKVAKVPDEYRAGFNPFSLLDPKSQNLIDDCDSIADALIVSSQKETDNHWNSTARIILRGFIAWIATTKAPENRNMNELRRMLYLSSDDSEGDVESFEYLLADMKTNPHKASGVPAEVATAIMAMAQRERSSVFSTIRQNTAFLSSPPIAKALSDNQRCPDLNKWKFGGTSIYLCLPAGRLNRHSRFFRLFVNQLLLSVEYSSKVPDIPALILLDEMHVLGYMASLETAMGLLAGYGVRIWTIWQDLSQLKHIYNQRWETFMGNSGILQFFGLNDLVSLKYVSERLGKSSMLSVSKSQVSKEKEAGGFTGESKSIQSAPLLSPDEVAYYFSRQSNHQLLVYSGSDPIFADRLAYWENNFKEVMKL